MQTGHVGINVTDLERSRNFYQTVFGFSLAQISEEAGRRFAFLSQGDEIRLTLWEQAAQSFDGSNAGLHHLSFRVDSRENVEEIAAKLRDLEMPLLYDGIVPHSEDSESGGIFFLDPDGTRLEVFTPHSHARADAPTPGAPTCGFF